MNAVDSLVKLVGILLLLAVLRLNWGEGATVAETRAQARGRHASLMGTATWWVAATLDDLFAAGFLIAVIRIIDGASGWNLLFAAPWIATTFLILKSAGQLRAWDFVEKLADDVRDGWAVATFIIFWMGWASLSMSSFNITF